MVPLEKIGNGWKYVYFTARFRYQAPQLHYVLLYIFIAMKINNDKIIIIVTNMLFMRDGVYMCAHNNNHKF
jgi:hypothetical protein